jgi:serine/threonine-protein kinase
VWFIDPSRVTPLEMTARGPKKLSRGSFASIHAATLGELVVAVKEFHADITARREFRERFIHEIMINFSYKHRNLCCVHGGWDILDEEKSIFPSIIVELVPLKLTDVMADCEKYKITIAVKISIIKQLAKCLSDLHSRHPPVFHCDVKPENIMLTEDMTVKLIDFGLARAGSGSFASLPGSGGVRGTYGYLVWLLL